MPTTGHTHGRNWQEQHPSARRAFNTEAPPSFNTSQGYVQWSLSKEADNFPPKTVLRVLAEGLEKFGPNPGASLLAEAARRHALNYQDEKATDLFKQALAVDPYFTPALSNYARLLRQKGEYPESEKLYARLYSIKGNKIGVGELNDIGHMYEEWHDSIKSPGDDVTKLILALGCFQYACKKFPDGDKVNNRRAKLQKRLGTDPDDNYWPTTEKHLLSIDHRPAPTEAPDKCWDHHGY